MVRQWLVYCPTFLLVLLLLCYELFTTATYRRFCANFNYVMANVMSRVPAEIQT